MKSYPFLITLAAFLVAPYSSNGVLPDHENLKKKQDYKKAIKIDANAVKAIYTGYNAKKVKEPKTAKDMQDLAEAPDKMALHHDRLKKTYLALQDFKRKSIYQQTKDKLAIKNSHGELNTLQDKDEKKLRDALPKLYGDSHDDIMFNIKNLSSSKK